MKDFFCKNKLTLLMVAATIAVIVSTMLHDWFNKPIMFENAPEYWSVTRNDKFDFNAHNAAEGKRGYRGYLGYFITPHNKNEFKKTIDIVSRLMLFDLLEDLKSAPSEVRKNTINNQNQSIVFEFNASGLPLTIYSFQDNIMAVESTLEPYKVHYYYIDTGKLTNLISHYIALVEKQHPNISTD